MKTILFNNVKKGCLFVFLISTILSHSQVQLKNQGFEGSTSDNLSYSVSSTSYVTVSNTTAMSGTRSLRFTGSSNNSSNVVFENVLLTNYTNAQVSIAFAATNVDDDEDLFIDFSYNNGSSYTSTIQLIDGNNGGNGQNLTFGTGDTAPGQPNNPYFFNIPNNNSSVRIRVRATNLDSSEFF